MAELRAAALRARATGFSGTAEAIEAIIDAELARRGRGDHGPDEKAEPGPEGGKS